MRKAKVAALVFGGVSTCIFGGLLCVYTTAPTVSSVTPNNDVENIYEVKNEELANVAAVTSIRTTPKTTTSTAKKYSITFQTSTATGSTTTTTTTAEIVIEDSDTPTMSAPFAAVTPSGSEILEDAPEEAHEAPTEEETEAQTNEPDSSALPEAAEPEYVEQEDQIYDDSLDYWYTSDDTDIYDEDLSMYEEYPDDFDYTAAMNEYGGELPISEEDYIILCNAVAHEAGCNWISTTEKALVVEVIMNRVDSPLYPNSIKGVLSSPYQFSGSASYISLGKFSRFVTQDVQDAVALYFNDIDSFDHGYFGFYGDGYRNYFY